MAATPFPFNSIRTVAYRSLFTSIILQVLLYVEGTTPFPSKSQLLRCTRYTALNPYISRNNISKNSFGKQLHPLDPSAGTVSRNYDSLSYLGILEYTYQFASHPIALTFQIPSANLTYLSYTLVSITKVPFNLTSATNTVQSNNKTLDTTCTLNLTQNPQIQIPNMQAKPKINK